MQPTLNHSAQIVLALHKNYTYSPTHTRGHNMYQHLCSLTGLPVPATTGRGHPFYWASKDARALNVRWQAVVDHMIALKYTPEAASKMRGMCVALTNGIRTRKEDGTTTPPKQLSKPVRADFEPTGTEAELLHLIAVVAAVHGTLNAKSCKVHRCVITGAVIYAGSRNPRKYINDDARLIDLRIQQLRTLLTKVEFTPKKARTFRAELYAMSCTMNSNEFKAPFGGGTGHGY